MYSHSTEQLEVFVTEPVHLNRLLDDAEAALQQVATSDRRAGILVTRQDAGRFTLELSDAVPFGETREQNFS